MAETDQRPRRLLRLLECVVGFFVLPPCLYLVRRQLAFRLLPIVILLAAGCMLYLVRTEGVDRRTLCSPADIRRHLRGILVLFLPAALPIAVLTALYLRPRFLALPLHAPWTWIAVMLLYPVLAAYPQELIFRAFFFARYGSLFPNPIVLVAVNGLSFGLAHLLYGNWIAVVLSTLGGFLFAYRYLQTGSLLAVSLEHGLWGDFLFTVGVGWYLYSGAIH